MVKPRVPPVKQVNLYQKGFKSRKITPSTPSQGPGILVPPHTGTVVCLKTLVPQTGKAVEGVCPGVEQDWPATKALKQIRKVAVSTNFIYSGPVNSLLEHANIKNAAREANKLFVKHSQPFSGRNFAKCRDFDFVMYYN